METEVVFMVIIDPKY